MMMRKWSAVLLGVLTLAASGPNAAAQARSPGTDVWVVPMKEKGIAVIFGQPRNATNRPGYDNQPSFTPKSDAVLYTSTDASGKTDAWRFSLPDGKPARVTNLPMSVYSPTVTPDGKFISFIRVEPDSTQLLWKLPVDGEGTPSKVIDNLKVGYHVWADENTLIVYVLPPGGSPRGTPSTLQLVDVRTGKAEVIAKNVGRALAKVPGRDAVTYQQLVKDSLPWITELDLSTKLTRPMVQTPPGADYFTWAPNGALITASGSRIFRYTDDGWAPVADFAKVGVKNISRIAVSPRGNWFAFVADDSASP